MDLGRVMIEQNIRQTRLYLALPDDALGLKIQHALPSLYDSSHYKTLDKLLVAISDEQPALILCHADLLADQKVRALSAIKLLTSARLLVIGKSLRVEQQVALLKQGARGYFDSALPLEKLCDALYSVLHGEVWIERHIISDLIDELTSAPDISEQQRAQLALLTPKEMDVAQLVSHGATNKMIAKKLMIAERTVKAHLTAIFQKTAITDRLSLAILFRDLR